MAKFYDVCVQWKDKPETKGRAIGNNVAWLCKCNEILLGPHEKLYRVPECPGCGRKFRVVRGKKPQFVARVTEQ